MDILSFAVVGAAVSLVVQGIKKLSGASEWKAIALTLVVSMVAGIVYNFVANTELWMVFINILAYASAVYAIVIKTVSE